MVLTGILKLDYHTAKLLPELWKAYRSEHGIPEALTTTVYQFGVSEESGDVLGFAYRSTTGFASEALNSGWRFKPECVPPESDDVLSDVRSMMIDQRSIQDNVPIEKRVFIGGQCLVHVLGADGYSVMNLFDFDDFQDQVHEVFSNHSS